MGAALASVHPPLKGISHLLSSAGLPWEYLSDADIVRRTA